MRIDWRCEDAALVYGRWLVAVKTSPARYAAMLERCQSCRATCLIYTLRMMRDASDFLPLSDG
ncbi:hypothetical protein Xclt_20610 [Xanthomonas axonopodis pv. clitoriae]|uniref:Uncharacterized protein n=1 Tax=Xanthomonas axonopodis pv. clitoriae TaxID=487828 RepID=A0AB73PDC0_9XANT|nr:hypothetical protein Xclt_20610 [Xanthomonas axonopodis pv. clitoriae]